VVVFHARHRIISDRRHRRRARYGKCVFLGVVSIELEPDFADTRAHCALAAGRFGPDDDGRPFWLSSPGARPGWAGMGLAGRCAQAAALRRQLQLEYRYDL
jgi:hypothetical protein